jgi:hypothetical protein
MTDDERIVNTADKWEQARHLESVRRFNLFMKILKFLGIAVAGILGAGVVGAGIFSVACTSEKEHAAVAAQWGAHTAAYQTCLQKGLGESCGCLWDATRCQPAAKAECREKLSAQTCDCLDDWRNCQGNEYQKCLLVMSVEECRCLLHREACPTSP